jgi:hypothetical protein
VEINQFNDSQYYGTQDVDQLFLGVALRQTLPVATEESHNKKEFYKSINEFVQVGNTLCSSDTYDVKVD